MDHNEIKQIRKDNKLTTTDLADIAGVSRRTVEGWEQGRPVPKPCMMLIGRWIDSQWIIISERWAQDEIPATMEEIQDQAKIYSEENPVTVETGIRRGCDVIIDDTGDIVAVSAKDYDKYFE